MFVTPKIGFSSPSSPVPKFQGFHFHQVKHSAYVGSMPDYYQKNYYPVYVTDDVTDEDDGLKDYEKPGFDKFRFESSKTAHKAAIAATDSAEEKEKLQDRFEAYKQSLMSYAAANWDSIVAQYPQPEASENIYRPPSRTSSKKVIIAAFLAFLMITNALLKPTR